MNNKKRVLFGIVLMIAAAGLLILAFIPEAGLAGVEVWKWFVGAVLIYWLFNNLIFGKKLKNHFDVFMPLALLFIVFEEEIAPLLGKEPDFVNNWLIFGVGALLTVGIHLLLGGFDRKNVFCGNVKGHINIGKKHDNRFSSSVCYFDLAEGNNHSVSNRLGETNVFFQNTDMGDTETPVTLNVENELGQTTVNVPADWRVTMKVCNELGDVNTRPDLPETTREIIVTGSNRLGELSIES